MKWIDIHYVSTYYYFSIQFYNSYCLRRLPIALSTKGLKFALDKVTNRHHPLYVCYEIQNGILHRGTNHFPHFAVRNIHNNYLILQQILSDIQLNMYRNSLYKSMTVINVVSVKLI